MKKVLIDFFAFISIILYPYKLSLYVSIFFSYVMSRRFCYLSHNLKKKVYMEYPFYVKGHKYIKCGNFYSHAGLRLECWDNYGGQTFSPSIIIGNNVCFNFRCHVGAINRVQIGNNVLIGSNVLITDHSHGYNTLEDINIPPANRPLYSKGMVIIEDNVWIGENVSILPNVRVGKNSVIGANSVVLKDVPAYSIVAGNPARIIKYIKNEEI